MSGAAVTSNTPPDRSDTSIARLKTVTNQSSTSTSSLRFTRARIEALLKGFNEASKACNSAAILSVSGPLSVRYLMW